MFVHIVRNSVSHDSRVLKETQSLINSGLAAGLEISGFHEPGFSELELIGSRVVHRVKLKTRNFPKDIACQSLKYVEWYRSVVNRYRFSSLSVIHCHDLEPLPIAVRLKQLTGAKLIYDAHELETERAGVHGVRQFLARRLESMLIPKVDAMITVSPSIQSWYRERFPRTPIHLVRNIPQLPEMPAGAQPLRQKLGVPDDALLFIYLGGFAKGRGIEVALKAFAHSRVRHHVLFMGSGALKESIVAAGVACDRIHCLAPVPPSEVVSYAAGADVGLCFIENICLSYRYCLPNKLFESLLAGLPVLASDLPDQADIVRKHGGGWVVPYEAEGVADFLVGLNRTEAVALRAGLAGRVSDLRWENEERVLLSVYKELLGGNG